MKDAEHFTGSMGLGSLFEAINVPDIMTPSQYFSRVGQSSELSGENRLKLAVLTDAIECYQRNGWAAGYDSRSITSKRRKLYADALEWIEGADAPITFDDCCAGLGIDAGWLRAGIKHGTMAPMPKANAVTRPMAIGTTPNHHAAQYYERKLKKAAREAIVMDGLFQEVAE